MKENVKNFPVVLKNKKILIGHIVFFNYFGNHTYEVGWVFNSPLSSEKDMLQKRQKQ